MQWIQNPSQCNVDNLNNVRREVSRHFRNKKKVIKSRRMRWPGHVARMGEDREVYRVLVGKPERRRPLGRPRHRRVDNIRTDLQEVGCG
jgi:transposase-like protein